MSNSTESLWFILEKIQKDIDRIEEKQTETLLSSANLNAKVMNQLDGVSTKVQELNKLLTLDNGKPSIVSRLDKLAQHVVSIETNIAAIKEHVGLKTKDPKEVAVERYKTIGKIGVATAAVIPGILSFIHSFFP